MGCGLAHPGLALHTMDSVVCHLHMFGGGMPLVFLQIESVGGWQGREAVTEQECVVRYLRFRWVLPFR